MREVKIIQGRRKSDQSIFYGLKFFGVNHASIFVTPGQFRTIVSLAGEASKLLRKVPKLSPEKKEQTNG